MHKEALPALYMACLANSQNFMARQTGAKPWQADRGASDHLVPPAAHQPIVVQYKHRHLLLTSNQPWQLFTVSCPSLEA